MKTKLKGLFAIAAVILATSCAKEGSNMNMKEVKREEYRLEVEKGHFIALIGGKRVLVDTGSPVTGGSFSTPFWGDVKHLNAVTGVPLKTICDLSGVKFDALIGMDLLGSVNFSFRLKEKKMIVFREEPEGKGTEVPLDDVMSVPVIPVTVNGRKTTMLLDTGAFISYYSEEMVGGLEPERQQKDYYPVLGKFTTPVYSLDIGIARRKVTMEGGVLPLAMRAALAMVSSNPAIMGNRIFEHFDADFLMLREKKVIRMNPASQVAPGAGKEALAGKEREAAI